MQLPGRWPGRSYLAPTLLRRTRRARSGRVEGGGGPHPRLFGVVHHKLRLWTTAGDGCTGPRAGTRPGCTCHDFLRVGEPPCNPKYSSFLPSYRWSARVDPVIDAAWNGRVMTSASMARNQEDDILAVVGRPRNAERSPPLAVGHRRQPRHGRPMSQGIEAANCVVCPVLNHPRLGGTPWE
jgi:hypothetical protein